MLVRMSLILVTCTIAVIMYLCMCVCSVYISVMYVRMYVCYTEQPASISRIVNDCFLQISLGGMIYDPDLERGIRKEILPEPNPTKVEMPKNASLEAVFHKAKDLYFKDDVDEALVSYKLADSGGIPIHVDDTEKWNLGDFYQQNGLVPSRYKLCYDYVFSSECN